MPRTRTVDLRWNAILNDFRRNGLTQAEFCRRRQISLSSFRNHLYKPSPSQTAASDDRSPVTTDHHFLPVTILPDPSPSITASQPCLKLILSKGCRIVVPPGFDPQTLRRLISVVEGRPCSD